MFGKIKKRVFPNLYGSFQRLDFKRSVIHISLSDQSFSRTQLCKLLKALPMLTAMVVKRTYKGTAWHVMSTNNKWPCRWLLRGSICLWTFGSPSYMYRCALHLVMLAVALATHLHPLTLLPSLMLDPVLLCFSGNPQSHRL